MRLWGVAGLFGAVAAALAAMAAYVFIDSERNSVAASAVSAPQQNRDMAALPVMKGPSGLPLPRFVSLKSDRVRVRRGPSTQYRISWVYRARGLPVEVVAEFEEWRRIRDADGEEGWIRRSLLSGWRTVMIAPWRKNARLPLRSDPSTDASVVAMLASGVIGRVISCTGTWCRIRVGDYEGWLEQGMLWGVYAGEILPARSVN